MPVRFRPAPRGLAGAATALAGATLTTVLLAPPAHAVPDCGAVLTADTTLTADLLDCPGNGLVIGAKGIMVDLNGHTVDGVGLGVGISNNGFDDVTITNSAGTPGTIKDFDYGVQLNSGTLRNVVQQLTIELNELAGVHLNNAGTNQIRNNTIRTQSNEGVMLLGGSDSNVVLSNQITGNGGEGIDVQGSAANRIESNTIADGGDRGVVFSGSSRNDVLSNAVTNNSDGGVVLLAASNSNTLRGNTITLSQDASFVINDSNANLVELNIVTDNGDAGISVLESDNTRILSNIAHRHSDSGIAVQDAVNTEIRGNDVRFNPGGLELNSTAGGVVANNLATDVTGIGISLEDVRDADVLNNTASSNEADGIYLVGETETGAGVLLSGNTASSNLGNGIQVAATGHTVTGNRTDNNAAWGILVAPGTIDGGGNTATGNGEPTQCSGVVCTASPQ
ncbi:MAG: right-handed parallel beta-helix repeat-containing protein [Pseudonocardiaceae bacterium]